MKRIIALAGCLAIAAGGWVAYAELRAKPAEKVTPRYGNLVEAGNPTRLHVADGGGHILGWVSGTEDYAGKKAMIYPNGDYGGIKEVEIAADNTFRWPYDLVDSKRIRVTVPGLESQVIHTTAASKDGTPSVFFIVDRTAYRPGQTLHFAGFLRSMNEKGDFEPIANKEVLVELTSARKGTKAGKFRLTSDSFGKIAGSYPFTANDALDDYTLAVKDFKGSANLLLAEYRKSKISLKISGEVKDQSLDLTFKTVDFLDKAVAAKKLHYTVQVVKPDKEAKAHALNAAQFAVQGTIRDMFFDLDEIDDDTRDLWIADGSFPLGLGQGGQVVHQNQENLTLNGVDPGTASIKLNKDWKEGGYKINVQAVVTDAYGREQRNSYTHSLTCSTKIGAELTLKVREQAEANEAFEVHLTGPLPAAMPEVSLVVMRMTAAMVNPVMPMYGYGYGRPGRNDIRFGGPEPTGPETVRMGLVTAMPMKDGKAIVKLSEPGAYKLVAVVNDGGTKRIMANVVVRESKDIPNLILDLKKTEWEAGEKLEGTLHGKYRRAKVLLTLKDTRDIQWHKVLTLDADGRAKIDEQLPVGLKYGCVLQAVYLDGAERVDVASKFVRINPLDRQLTINAKTPEEVKPGETVTLDIDVNRQEEIDLVVSVYDQSLLGIRADKAVDIKDFYLADERARDRQAMEFIRAKIGGVTLKGLLAKLDAKLADEKYAVTPEGQLAKHTRDQIKSNGNIDTRGVALLLQLLDVPVRLDDTWMNYYGSGWHLTVKENGEKPFADLIGNFRNDYRMVMKLIGDRVALFDSHRNYLTYNRRMLGYYGGGGGGAYMNQWNLQAAPGGFGGYARGDSMRGMAVMGNSSMSFMPEGQAAFSMMPMGGAMPGGTVPLLDVDPDQGHVEVRRDFSDSAFWKADMRTDSQGKAKVQFKVPDSLTNWQVVVTGVSRKMHVGSAKAKFRTFKPIMVWPMLPRNFMEGDRCEVFGTVHNRTQQEQEIKVRLKMENGEILSNEEKTVKLAAMQSTEVYWNVKALKPGFTQLLMIADCPAGSDASLKRLPVNRLAIDDFISVAGQVKDSATLTVPEGLDLANAQLEMSFAPSLAADMADTLNYLVEYPYGCVEQTMSRFLPAIKVAQILKQFQVDHPELNAKMPNVIAGGIKRLLELQQPDGGWGWHGGTQTHEMMTPYALYGLLQAEKAGYAIPNENAIQQGLQRLDYFIQAMMPNQQHIADTLYCLYVYTHRNPLKPEHLAFLKRVAENTLLSDYGTALALEMCVQQKQDDLAKTFAARLRGKADRNHLGWVTWKTAGFSRWGEDKFEITAAAMKALVAFDKDDPLVDGILGFFAGTKRGDRWNSTKDTAMILFAMCDYLAKANFDPNAKNTLSYQLNDGAKAEVKFEDKLVKKIALPGTSLKHGANTVKFESAAAGMMYRLVLRHWKTGDAITAVDKGIAVERKVFLLDESNNNLKELKSGDSVPRGSYLVTRVTASTKILPDMRFALMESPKPASAEIVPADDARFANQQPNTGYALREERMASVAFHHEHAGNQFANNAVMLAELAGDFTIAPAYVELMYQTDIRGYSAPFKLRVVDK